ncbi:MAG TPA: alpha/beta fold hydrolase [Gammaproteobacteria bacterium]
MSAGPLHVAAHGAGRDLALVHGWGFSGPALLPLAERLARTRRVHLVDLPGHGGSRAVPFPATLVELAGLLADSVPGAADWAGWSLGGLACLQLALARPERVARLALVCATPRFAQADDWMAAVAADTLQGFTDGLAADPAGTLARFAGLAAHGDLEQRAVLRRLRAELANADAVPEALGSGLALLADSDLRAAGCGLAVPLLCLLGSDDALVPAAAATALAALWPKGRVEVIAGAGHAPFVARPDACHAALERFLDE